MAETAENETGQIQGSVDEEETAVEPELTCISPFVESRQDSNKGTEEENEDPEENNSLLDTIDKIECHELPPPHRVRFKTRRDVDLSKTEVERMTDIPKSSSDRTLGIPKPFIRGVGGGDGENVETKNKRQSVFERLARTETVAFIHQKFHQVKRSQHRSVSAPPPIDRAASFSKLPKPKDRMNISNHSSPKPRSSMQIRSRDKMNISNHSSPTPRLLRRQSTNSSHKKYRRPSLTKILSERTGSDEADKFSEFFQRNNHYVSTPPTLMERWKSDNNLGRRRKNSHERLRMKTGKNSVGDSLYSRLRTRDEMPDMSASVEVPLYIEFSNRTKIICSNQYTPERGYEDLDSQKLGINRALTEYEAGSLAAKNLASKIMHALLCRDLPKGLKWKINFPLERELAMPIGELGYSFFIEAIENKDVDDAKEEGVNEKIHTASATGNVSFLPDRWEIHIENYSCVHDANENYVEVAQRFSL